MLLLTQHTLRKTIVCVSPAWSCVSATCTVVRRQKWKVVTSFKTYKQSSESLHQGRAAWAVTKATNAVCRFDITSWFPGLQLSVFVFLSIVVSSLGLLGQLSAVLGLFVLVSSALRVRWPEGSLLLGIGAGTEYTKTHTHTPTIQRFRFFFWQTKR